MRSYIILFLAAISLSLSAQQTATDASKFFEAGQYEEAKVIYGKLLKKSPRNPLNLYRYARCAQMQGEYEEAIQYFKKSGDKYVLRYFFTAECQMALWHYQEAIASYQTYLEKATETDRTEYIHQQIALAETSIRYLKHVHQLAIIDSVTLPKEQFLSAYPPSEEVGNLFGNKAGGITYTNPRNDRRIFSSHADTTDYLYSQYRLLDRWSNAEKLPTNINFTNHQGYPFYLSDGVTLYFAVQDPKGLGGWDIYISRFNSDRNTYTVPENLGFPFNSSANDYMLVIDETHQIGYFATDRFCSSDSVTIYSYSTEQDEYVNSDNIDTLALYAQLRCYKKSSQKASPRKAEVPTAAKSSTSRPASLFVLNDEQVYYSLDDFRSPDSRMLFDQYIDLMDNLTSLRMKLEKERQLYASSSSEKRKEMAAAILQMEKSEQATKEQADELIKRIRKIEMEAHKTPSTKAVNKK